ncbi:prepilin-type N-terminal cleavage/methylation domain-containing protein [Candidatus Poribacteria bacterium]|nr:prepilin-type N-terminal cleavage/methylation domain-containing protein [Candidatus Poribacteria bacterium]
MIIRGNHKGFTLIELLLVVVILAVLAAIAIPRFSSSAKEAKISACKANIANINTQLELYYTKNGTWPDNLSDFLNNKEYFPDGPPTCPFGDPYELDPKTHRVVPHNHQ